MRIVITQYDVLSRLRPFFEVSTTSDSVPVLSSSFYVYIYDGVIVP